MKQDASPIQFKHFKTYLSPRPRDAHKGLFGHVLVIGGYQGMTGAARLAAEAALRVGAGLVSVATQAESITPIMNGRPEIMAHTLKTSRDLMPLLKKANVVVVGTGLGQSRTSEHVMTVLLKTSHVKVVDADGLNVLAKKQPKKSNHWILTPHPGEAARLLECSVKAIQANRIEAVKALQKRYGGVIVLKGAQTLVCTRKSLCMCLAGNPGMASGGMGDVLSGVIGGLLAQGFSLQGAAECGVYLHATAGDKAAVSKGERGLLASDLMDYLHQLVN
ncbi:NAD(P)H-hydrate dehydratase [Rickettsiella grylli]|uniref:ADP-dependent (S)-NAD(P)H-hydrate dehydratase n=1 Tax=Rickettsiella grylli TaxID=59196 RepID=A8PN18_9COXI|nr:NAD(P)H-hydrate dehydratase [Rickettsiella grylli]EDP46613.1 putative YjeF homolog, C-terminus [Rickettsiella grylli]